MARDRHPTAKKNSGTRFGKNVTTGSDSWIKKGFKKVETWLTLGALVLTAISAYLLLRANQISQGQASENLVVSQASMYGGNLLTEQTPDVFGKVSIYSDKGASLYCSHLVRLSNLGGIPANILDFSVRASYLGEVVYLEGYGESTAFPKDKKPFKSLLFEQLQATMVSKEMAKKRPLDRSWLDNYDGGITFPLEMPPHSSEDFIIYVIGTKDETDHRTFFSIGPDEPVRGTPPPHDNPGFSPVLMTYTFDTSTGKRSSTTPLECWSMRVFPQNQTLEFDMPSSSGTPSHFILNPPTETATP